MYVRPSGDALMDTEVRGPRIRRVGQADQAAPDLNETVCGQRLERLEVEAASPPGPLGDEGQRPGAALPERAFEGSLLSQRLVAPASGRTFLGERARVTARDPRQANGRSEVHQRMSRGGPELAAGPLEHAADVGVDRQNGPVEGEPSNGVRCVPAHTGKLR